MDSKEIIYRLLYLAMLELRVEEHTIQNNKMFHLADLFHNVPLQLERVSRGDEAYDDVLTWVENRAAEKGCEEWLQRSIDSIRRQRQHDPD